MQKLAVQNLRVRLQRLDFCESFQVLSGSPSVYLPDGRREFAVGDLVSDEERIVCFAVEVLPLPSVQGAPVVSLEGEKLLALEILYDEISESGLISKAQQQIVRIQATPDPDEIHVNETVVGWVAMQRAGLTIQRATDELAGGRAQKAQVMLEEAIRYLSGCSAKDRVAPALVLLTQLLDQVQQGEISSRNLKLHKSRGFYSSRSSSRLPPGFSSSAPPPTGSPPPPPPVGPK